MPDATLDGGSDKSSLLECAAPRHPLAEVVGRLWTTKPPGGTAELYIRGGEVLVVEELVALDKQQPFAVFAARQADGKYKLIVLAWEAVERVVIGGVEKLPDAPL